MRLAQLVVSLAVLALFVAVRPTQVDAQAAPPVDAGSCTRTVQPGSSSNISNAPASPGDTVCVAPGTYQGNVSTSRSGTSSARIRYVCTTRWACRIVGSSGSGDVWSARGSHVDIEGFDVTGPGTRIGISNSGSFVRILGNRVHDISTSQCFSGGGAAILNGNYSSSDNDIIGNVVINSGPTSACNTTQGIYHSVLRGRIQNNMVFRGGSFGIHLWHAANAVTITNNLVVRSQKAGIIVGAGDSPGGVTTANTLVANNILVSNGAQCVRDLGAVAASNRYLNNICHQNGSGFGVGTGTVSGTINADPRLVNFQPDGSGDYRLQSSSPAVDAGTSQGAPTTDYFGAARPRGAAIDIGPYEFGSGTASTPPPSSSPTPPAPAPPTPTTGGAPPSAPAPSTGSSSNTGSSTSSPKPAPTPPPASAPSPAPPAPTPTTVPTAPSSPSTSSGNGNGSTSSTGSSTGTGGSASAPTSGGATFHVALTGNNTNEGTSTRPWRTIQHAVNTAGPGATVFVAPGTYSESIVSSKSGTTAARIRFVSAQLWGARIVSAQPVVWRNNGNFVDIVGFDVSGSGGTQIGVLNTGSFVGIRDNHIHNIPAPGCTSSGGAGVDNASNTARDTDVIANIIHSIGSVSTPCNRTHGIDHRNIGGRIWNNIIYRNAGYGIHLWESGGATTIANNLLFQNVSGGIILGADRRVADNFVVSNNIIMDNPGVGIREIGTTGPNNRYLNNLVYGNRSDWRLQTGTQSGTLSVDPRLVDYKPDGSGDYHLSAASPALTGGTNVGAPPDDFEGTARAGGGFSIGPYEGP